MFPVLNMHIGVSRLRQSRRDRGYSIVVDRWETGPTILICDDEASIRQLVAMKLRSAGFEVVDAQRAGGVLLLRPVRAPSRAMLRVSAPLCPRWW